MGWGAIPLGVRIAAIVGFALCFALVGMGTHKVFSDRKIAKLKKDHAEYVAKVAIDKANVEAAFRAKETKIRDSADAILTATLEELRDVVAVRDRLRVELTATRNRLKAAELAPAECRDYAAPPTQLSTVHAEMVAELAYAADVVVLERNACIAQYNAAREALNEVSN